MRTTANVPTPQASSMPVDKYIPFLESNPIDLPTRTWPTKRMTRAPRWLSTDLRDGNQALIEPMDPTRKRAMFDLLVSLGYKEIEIGFPAASQTDYDFVRSLIDDEAIPEDVTVSVLTQSRTELIERTIDALVGIPRATVHLYNATSPLFRELVFRMDKAQTVDLAQSGTREIMARAEKVLSDDTIFGFEYSPEIFVDTELDFAAEICEAVMDIWQPDDDREIVLNLPATVERATPNVFADQIEWMSTNLSRRDHIALSVHPHNDRGTGVAAAELALLAGADRVEGCLLGQGERTGNVDLVNLGLNMMSQGIDPGIDFSDVDRIRHTVEHCTMMETPPRMPYVGDLVYTSFSGSHQDAIKKGFEARKKKVAEAGGDENAVPWGIPYLPIDPHDVGRSYERQLPVRQRGRRLPHVDRTPHGTAATPANRILTHRSASHRFFWRRDQLQKPVEDLHRRIPACRRGKRPGPVGTLRNGRLPPAHPRKRAGSGTARGNPGSGTARCHQRRGNRPDRRFRRSYARLRPGCAHPRLL